MSTHHILQNRIDTPLGPMLVARSRQGLSGLWFEGQRHHPGDLGVLVGSDPLFDRLAAAITRYFHGEAFDAALLRDLDPAGTQFQRAVWRALLAIPSGETQSYGTLAALLGRPSAVRAVGAAIGRNPISIVIPCHRVLGADGSLTGYAGGLPRKEALLTLEGARFH